MIAVRWKFRAAGASVRWMIALAIIALVSVVPERECSAQPPVQARTPATAPGDWQYRFDLFQMLLEQEGLQPITDVREAFRDPESTLIVSLGRISPSFPVDRVPSFISRGSMLIATDGGFRFPPLAVMAPGSVTVRRAADSYQGFEDCIRVTEIADGGAWTAGIGGIVANRSGWISGLAPAPGQWRINARLPDDLSPPAASGSPLIASLTPPGATSPRLIIAADHTLVANGMMWHGDNALLAIKLCQALRRPGQRRLLFLVDGQPQPSYLRGPIADQIPPVPPDAPLPEEVPELELEQMLRVANTAIAKVEDSDLLNELVSNRPRRMRDWLYYRILLYIGLIILVAVAIYRFAPRARAAASPIPPRPMKPPFPLGVTKGRAIDTRGEVAQLLTREYLSEVSGSSQPEQWRRKIIQAAREASDKATRSNLLYLLALAENPRVPILSSAKLKEVGRMLDEMRGILSTHSVQSVSPTRT